MKEISGGSLHSERKESVRDKPVREYQIHALALRPNLIRVRSVVVGNQLYEQYVTAPRADVSGPAAGRFFGSLRLPR